MAEKDAEIDELRRMLAEQSGRVGEVAVGAQAIAELVDQDELIQEERENLKQLQVEWQEKLRTAEVELATERARIARERSQVEEQLQELESQRRELEELAESVGNGNGNATDAASAKARRRRRWFSRLGIDPDDEKE